MTLCLGDTYGRVASTKMVSSASALTADQSYTYDAAGRLATWTLAGATTTYTHDDAGNLTLIDRPNTTSELTMTYGLDNELLTSKLGAYTTTYTNDDYGRRTRSSSTAAGVATYTWDTVGQLASVTSAESTSTYAYGPSGMRERITVTSPGSSRITESVWEGGRLALERDDDGTTCRYVYGPDSLPLELIVTEQGGTPVSYAYLCDRAGSVIALTDSAGAVVATYAYDPWGAPTSQPASGIGARNPLRYRGYYYDVATALYYLPARYYDPAVARFLSVDPASPSAGDPLSLNRYAYCVGDPVNADDPSGAIMDRGGSTASSHAFHRKVRGGGYAAHLVASGSYSVKEAYAIAARFEASGAHQAWQTGVDNRYAMQAYGAAMADMRTARPVAARRAEEAIRSSWATSDPRDDRIGYGLSAVGTTCDIFALALVAECPLGSALFAGASHVFAGAELWHATTCFVEGRPGGTAADLALSVIGVVPVLGSINPRTFRALGSAADVVDTTGFILDTTAWFQ